MLVLGPIDAGGGAGQHIRVQFFSSAHPVLATSVLSDF